MKTKRQLIKIGKSIAITIPSIYIESHPEYNITDVNERHVIMDLCEDGTIIIIPFRENNTVKLETECNG